MGFFNRKTSKTGGQKAQRMPALNWTLVNGQWVYPGDSPDQYITQGYKGLPNVYSIISLIIQKSSIVPFEVFKVKDRAKHLKYKAAIKSVASPKDMANALRLKNEAFEKIEGHEVEKLLLQPNQHQGAEDFNREMDGYNLLTGNSYAIGYAPEVGINANKPKELHVMPAPMVTIITGDFANPVKGYKFNLDTQEIPADRVIHIKQFNPVTTYATPENMVYGMSPLASCRRLLGKYKDADIAQGSMFKNMGPAGILSNESEDATEDQAKALKDLYRQTYSGSYKAGDIIIAASKYSWQQIGLSPVDLNIIESKEEILNELCNVFHVPIGMFTKVNSTENNMVESRKMFITDAVMPLVEQRKSAFNRQLVPKFGDDITIEYDYTVFPEIREDLEKLVKSAKEMYYTTPNEKRAMTGYDQHPSPEMDKFYFPSGLTPLEQLNIDMQAGQVPPIDEALLNED